VPFLSYLESIIGVLGEDAEDIKWATKNDMKKRIRKIAR
jgi:hypothetical protein